MDSGHDKKRKNVEGDRLSNLPDDLIHKILSYISIKQAVETSRLSSRWRYIWTSMPYLNFLTEDFDTLLDFSKFVNRLLSNRNNQSDVYSVKLSFQEKVIQLKFVKSILNYAVSHNVQQLGITGDEYPLAEFLPSLSSSKSLKHLTLTWCICKHPIMTINNWALPTLTSLNLYGVTFYDYKCADLFSNCPNLKNLTFQGCIMLKGFMIRHPGLSSLTLVDGHKRVNVVTPRLKSLTIKYWRGIHLVSAPDLSSLRYTDTFISFKNDNAGPLQLPTDLLHLEKVDICIHSRFENKAYTHKIFCLLQQLHSVKFLTLNLELVKFFSSVKLISHQTSPFVNLESLKVYPVFVSPEAQQNVTMSDEVKNFLLDGSPSATFTMVSHEEIQAVKNITSARNLMSELQDMLVEYFEINMTDIEQAKTLIENHMATGRKIRAMKPRIDELLKLVPTSHLYKFQARLSAMCADFNTILIHGNDQIN